MKKHFTFLVVRTACGRHTYRTRIGGDAYGGIRRYHVENRVTL